MGIPFYYRQIILKDQRKLLANLNACDRLYLDYNSIIHTCAAEYLSERNVDAESFESNVFARIYDHTMMLTKICKPSNLLYVAIDGVAPRSKIHQQRKRRYLSAYRNEIINKFKDAQNIPYVKWDSNAITPGTAFMARLKEYLSDRFASAGDAFRIRLSGADEPGEGEHKIFEHIRAEAVDDPESHVDVIYGLDADLIMLSLCSEASHRIYLMREGQNFATGLSDFKYLNISNLKSSVSSQLCENGDGMHMYDYVFICFLLGNDFVPNLACLKIKGGAIELLCDVYRSVRADETQTLVERRKDRYCVNVGFLIAFFEELSRREDALMRETTLNFYEEPPRAARGLSNKLDKFASDLDNYPSIHKFPPVIDPAGDKAWKNAYYFHLFGDQGIDMVRNACENYIEGLLWTMNYYMNHKVNLSWFYKYNYAPCASDVYKYLKTMDFDGVEKDLRFGASRAKVDANMQLLMVLPPFSKGLLGQNLQKIMEEIEYGCAHYYPKKFCLTTYLKHYLWECAPVLPQIDAERLFDAYEKLSTK